MRTLHSLRYRLLLDRLQAARRQAGLTQAEVAKAMGRPQSFVSKCESGERRLDALELAELAGLYGKPLGFFVGEPGRGSGGGASLSAETDEASKWGPRRRKRRAARPSPRSPLAGKKRSRRR